MKKLFLIVGPLALLSFFVHPASAADDCTIIYGGGEIKCTATVSATAKVTPTPAKSEQAPATESAGTTKGGLPVYEPVKSAETPNTGPEVIALISLIPAAGLGFYLRKKTK